MQSLLFALLASGRHVAAAINATRAWQVARVTRSGEGVAEVQRARRVALRRPAIDAVIALRTRGRALAVSGLTVPAVVQRSLLISCLAAMLATGQSAGAEEQTPVISAAPAMRQVTLTGFTRARARLPIAAEREGRVQSVSYDIGDTIGADGLFAQIDDTFVKLSLEEIAVQQDRLRTQIAFDEREVARYERLARENNAAAAQLDTFEQTLRNNRHELLQLDVQQRVLEERLRRTRVSAPPGWRVTERHVEPGQWVRVGEALGEVAEFATLVVPFALTSQQYRALMQTVENGEGLALDLAGPESEKPIPASVYRSNPAFDPETRKLHVELKLDAPLEDNRGGLRARLTLSMPERSGAVLLPAGAVRRSHEEYWVDPVEGEPLRVVLLGREQGSEGELFRVSAPGLSVGDRLKLQR